MSTYQELVSVFHQHVGELKPQIGIICGSGLSALADAVEDAVHISYADLPGFPKPSVEGHAGTLTVGKINAVPAVVLQGRAHYYEGIDSDIIKHYVRALKLFGCHSVFITNSAGSLRADVTPGNLVMITDHINMQGRSPLVGPNQDEFGPRFCAMEEAYDPTLNKILQLDAHKLDIQLHSGVYCGVLGPQFETPAEINGMRILGADLVGMSTIPEVIIARHCGLKVCAVSVVTNLAAGMNPAHLSHDETLENAGKATKQLRNLIIHTLPNLAGAYEGS